MAVYKLSGTSVKNGRTEYSSFLAGNPKFTPNSYESISTVTVGSGGAADIEFTSIPATYTHLQIRAICKSDQTGTSGEFEGLALRFNSDTGSNYARHFVRGNGSTATAGSDGSQTLMSIGLQPDAGYSSVSQMFSAQILDILDYANTNKYKTIRNLNGFDSNNTGTNVGAIQFSSGLWMSTSAITSIKFSSGGSFNRGFTQYSQFALYGIKGA
jgi:hypothetical protein